MVETDPKPIAGQIDPKLLTALSAFGPVGTLIGIAGMGALSLADLIIANAHKTTIPTPEEWVELRAQIVAATFKSL